MSHRFNQGNSTPVDAAHDLIAQLHRSPDVVPPFDGLLMKECADRVSSLYQRNAEVLLATQTSSAGRSQEDTSLLLVRQATIDRIKRCCCAYVDDRRRRIQQLRWDTGGALPESVRQNLSPAELDFYKTYTRLVSEFQATWGDEGVNLQLYQRPPRNLLIQVRVLEDYGEFETSSGKTLVLKKNELHYLPTVDCEILITRGILEPVRSDIHE